MAFDSPDPVRPEAAIRYFAKKANVPDDELDELDAVAQAKAFRIAGIADVDLLSDVRDALNRALEKGTRYEDFVEEVGPELEDAWGGTVENPGWRTEVVFRNNVQKAYSAGRWKEHQEVADKLPYAILDIVRDPRTSEVCEDLDEQLKGMAMPADDPFWATHTPPLHHGCRSQIIYVDEAQAEEAGILRKAPKVEAAEGFGAAPDEDDWEPNPDDYPEDFRGAVEEIVDGSEKLARDTWSQVELFNENHDPGTGQTWRSSSQTNE